jgi:hypothetical protein
MKPTIDQILTSLEHEVLFGKSYLEIAKGLAGADKVVLAASPAFFGMTVEASLQMSQMFAAKLYDKTRGVVTVKSLLAEAQAQAGVFKHGTPSQVSVVVKNAESRIAGLRSILASVQDRRNQAIAHLDPYTVIDPAALAVSAKLTVVDLTKVFDETGAILNEISRLWADTYAVMELSNGDDFKSALDLIAEAKHALVDKWEKEFKEPCPHPRPETPRTQW